MIYNTLPEEIGLGLRSVIEDDTYISCLHIKAVSIKQPNSISSCTLKGFYCYSKFMGHVLLSICATIQQKLQGISLVLGQWGSPVQI